MGDFRIDRRGNLQPGNVSKRQPPPQRPAEQTPGGNQGGLNGFGDAITPELAERLRERRERMPQGGMGRGRHGHPPMPPGGPGHDPMGRPGRPEGFDSDRPFVGRGPVEPAQAAEDLLAKLDADGDGAVTKDEVTAFFEAQQARRRPAAPAAEETAVVEEAVVEEAIAETPVAEETEPSLAARYAEAQAQAISELQAFAGQEGLPEAYLALATQAMDAIYALDPAGADFEHQLNAAFEPLQTALANAAAEG